MKTPIFPVICGFVLTAMIAAVASHWWSLHQFSRVLNSEFPTSLATHFVAANPAAQPMAVATNESRPASINPKSIPAQQPHQKEFYEALIQKMANMENQNRDLLDQLAETNRDIMKLEFRVDTHSESFRPLPVSQAQPFSSLNTEPGIGVLPPRAEPVFLHTPE
jgi:hypothetical protein